MLGMKLCLQRPEHKVPSRRGFIKKLGKPYCRTISSHRKTTQLASGIRYAIFDSQGSIEKRRGREQETKSGGLGPGPIRTLYHQQGRPAPLTGQFDPRRAVPLTRFPIKFGIFLLSFRIP